MPVSGSVPVPSSSGRSERPRRLASLRRAGEIENRRRQVDLLDRRRDPPGAILARQLHDQRNVHGRVVEKEPVLLLAVIAEPFAVIGEQHDGRALVDARGAQPVEQPADDLVRVGDLAVIRLVGGEARRRRVGLVRLVDVEEEEERLLRIARPEPLLSGRERAFAIALDLADRALSRGRRQLAVVGVESLVQADRRSQHVGRHESAGRPPALLQRALDEPLTRP